MPTLPFLILDENNEDMLGWTTPDPRESPAGPRQSGHFGQGTPLFLGFCDWCRRSMFSPATTTRRLSRSGNYVDHHRCARLRREGWEYSPAPAFVPESAPAEDSTALNVP